MRTLVDRRHAALQLLWLSLASCGSGGGPTEPADASGMDARTADASDDAPDAVVGMCPPIPPQVGTTCAVPETQPCRYPVPIIEPPQYEVFVCCVGKWQKL
jgi:hypothetical protein